MLEKLSPIPPLQLPGLVVFLVSQRCVQTLSVQLYDLLDSSEKIRSAEFATRNLRHRFITGRAALRTVLSMLEAGAVPATEWRFGSTPNGKPYVQIPENSIHSFNLSYAEHLIAVAVSKEAEIGIDIELSHQIPQSEIPWHLFSTDEQRLLKATSAADFTPVFLRLWTLKEAIAKRTGQGFATEFSTIDTTALPVVDGLKSVGHRPEAGTLLFHTDLIVEGNTVFLSVSTAPFSRTTCGRPG